MNQLFGNSDFKNFLFNRQADKTPSKKLGKYRNLNKVHNGFFRNKIEAANVAYENLKGLALSDFAAQIVSLKVLIQADLLERNQSGGGTEITQLHFASVNYFPKIQSASINLTGCIQGMNPRCLTVARLPPELKHFRGMHFVNKSNIYLLMIQGQGHGMNVENSIFDRICESFYNFADVQIQNSQFLNQEFGVRYGLFCNKCNSLNINQIQVQSVGGGVHIYDVKNAMMDKVEISCYDKGNGCRLWKVPRFEINNTQVRKCIDGIVFMSSRGEIKNSVFQEYQQYAVVLKNSQVKYKEIQYGDNQEGYLRIDGQSNFTQLVN